MRRAELDHSDQAVVAALARKTTDSGASWMSPSGSNPLHMGEGGENDPAWLQTAFGL